CKGHPRRRRGCERCEGFGKLTKDSVQELIGWVIGKAAGTRRHKFHGAGREDVDVRMLGEGRPFVFELESPKVSKIDLAELEATINSRNEGRMEVRGLHWTQKGRVRFLKEGKFAKDYRARVAVSEVPSQEIIDRLVGRRYTVAQKTPSRVAHRRADLIRERWIEVLGVDVPAPGDDSVEPTIVVTLRTQAGTYVKEAISGEGGMTEPSVAQVLGISEARCLELDVLAILDEEGEDMGEAVAEPPSPFGAGL
ncbi:MAG: tRNA pseudouridine(54/55) synthase Pus10, partial [Planctomycetota bacterium]